MNNEAKKHSKMLVKILKNQDRYCDAIKPQVEVCAKAWGLLCAIEDEAMKPTIYQETKEKLGRYKANPATSLYLETLDRYQRALKALGLNLDSKQTVVVSESDTLKSFIDTFD